MRNAGQRKNVGGGKEKMSAAVNMSARTMALPTTAIACVVNHSRQGEILGAAPNRLHFKHLRKRTDLPKQRDIHACQY
jgi:hypothetical protein